MKRVEELLLRPARLVDLSPMACNYGRACGVLTVNGEAVNVCEPLFRGLRLDDVGLIGCRATTLLDMIRCQISSSLPMKQAASHSTVNPM
jgi:hypothetical protein